MYKRRFHVPQFLQFPREVEIFILLFTFSISVVIWDSKVDNFASSLLLLLLLLMMIIIRSGLLAEIWWSVCMSKSQRTVCVSFSRTDVGLCLYHLFVWSNFNFLHNSQWITLPTQSCIFLHSFCANLLHSLIMWLMVSSLSPHNQHLLFCCSVYSCFDMIGSYSIVLSCHQERFSFSLKASLS